jgi:hypothetical protein
MNFNLKRKTDLFIFVTGVVLAMFVGARNLSVGTDTINYQAYFVNTQSCMCLSPPFEPGFQVLTVAIAALGVGSPVYFFVLSLAMFFMVNAIAAEMCRQAGYSLSSARLFRYLILALFLISPFFASANVNVLRSGISGLLVIYALIALSDRRWKAWFAVSALAVSMHYSSLLYVLFGALIFVNPRALVAGVAVLSVAYAAGLTETVMTALMQGAGVDFLEFALNYGAEAEYKVGVRLDFLLFSWLVITPIVPAALNRPKNALPHLAAKVLNIYLVLLIPFLLLGYKAFSDRYALPAWLFLSVVMAYAAVGSKILRRHRLVAVPGLLLVSSLAFVSATF